MNGQDDFGDDDQRPSGLGRMQSFGLGNLPGILNRGDSILNVDSPVEPTGFVEPTGLNDNYQYLGPMTADDIMNMINSPDPHGHSGRTIDPSYSEMGGSLLPTPPVVGAPTNLSESLPVHGGGHRGYNNMGYGGGMGQMGGHAGIKAEEPTVDEGGEGVGEDYTDEGPRLLVTHQLIHWIGTPDNAPAGSSDAKEYWLQKGKVFNIKVQMFDGQGVPIQDTSEDIELSATLTYDTDNHEEVAQINADVMQGERVAKLQSGTVQFKLKMQVNSSQRDEQKFRVCIKPTDPELAANRNLWAFSEPVRVIAKLTKAKASRAQNTIDEEPEPAAPRASAVPHATAGGSGTGAPANTNWAEQISSQLNFLKGNLQNTQSQVESLQSNLTNEQRMRQELEEENRKLREAIKKKRRPDE